MKDILPGMTVHLTVGNFTKGTITVNGHILKYQSVYELALGACLMQTQKIRRYVCVRFRCTRINVKERQGCLVALLHYVLSDQYFFW